jgi:hypothetical protein
MVAAIQIIVAGALLVAWLWVLGRPLLAGPTGRPGFGWFDRGYLDATEMVPPLDRGVDPAAVPLLPRLADVLPIWRRHPVEYRRRQLMLATLFAAFGSFFLAVALRGRFFHLFLLMMGVLAVHVGVAYHIGARLVAAERAQRIAAARQRLPADGLSIQAPLAGVGSDTTGTIDAVTAAGGPALLDPAARREPHRSAFNVAAELASMLDGVDDREAAAAISRTFVSDLIEHEWGSAEVGGEAAQSVVQAPEPPSSEQPEPAPGARDREPGTAGPVPDADGSEAIFTRAVKDEPSRGRRKARPIHIHSHLDDAGDLPPARAVNDG